MSMAGSKSLLTRVIEFLEVEQPANATTSERVLQNHDLLPVPLEQRTWTKFNYFSFWIADSFNINTFMIASSVLGSGIMNWWQCWLSIFLGYAFAAFFLVLNAYPGAVHHLIFPSYIRASFGPIGALWPVFNRAAMACVWYGVQAWIGGECVYVLLCAMFPSTANIPNGIPNSGTDTGHFLGFFLFSALSLVAIWYPLHQIRHLFTLKAIVSPAAGIALFVWSLKKAGGAGPILSQPALSSSSAIGWVFVSSMMGAISNMATLITNAVDFASRSKQPANVILPQLIALPFTFGIVSFFGIIIASSSSVIFGEYVWSPLDLLGRFLDGDASSGTRAGVAFIAIGFIIAQLGTNIAANSISAGCDLTALLPRFIKIRRGGYVAAFVGFVMCPWQLLSDSNSFASYLSAYSVFLSSIVGVMVTNYWIVAKRRVKVDDLFTLGSDGAYSYYHGVNVRAYAAYIAGILINVVGFAGAVGVTVPIAATRLYELSFFTGFFTSSIVFYILNRIWPVALPSLAECATITVGRDNWDAGSASKEGSFEEKTDEDKEGAKTTAVLV